ncbi:MAG: hypothetical protein GY842_03155 [bacterium]|nr:hypothetical protein [bacterium]
MAEPVLTSVLVEEVSGGWRVRIGLANQGQAFIRVPVHVVAAGGNLYELTADLNAGSEVEISALMPEHPESVRLDPKFQVWRISSQQTLWTPAGGLQ